MSAAPAIGPDRWLYGPFRDLVFGCGLLYVLVFGLWAAFGTGMEVLLPSAAVATVFSLPHYGATLLRAYETREERRKYWLFTVHTTLLLAVLFGVASHHVLLGSLLVTLYFTWSPWHYTGQNYGLAVMFLRRRGIALEPRTKRALYLSFVLSYALVFLSLHGFERGDFGYAPGVYAEHESFSFLSLGLPFGRVALAIALAAYLAALGTSAALLLRVASLRSIAPSLVLALTQAFWFSLPVLARHTPFGDTEMGRLFASTSNRYAFILIAATGHAIQYLWITAYYARASRAAGSFLPFYVKTLVAGSALWLLPGLVFGPHTLGRFHFDAGLAVLTAAMVNLHHFALDGAIWKLRDGRIARHLIRSVRPEPASPAPLEPQGAGWTRRAVWAACALLFAASLAVHWESNVGFERALPRGDLARAETALRRLAWLGRDTAWHHLVLGLGFARAGSLERARAAFEESLAVAPTFHAWRALSRLHEQEGRLAEAAAACEEGLALRPDDPELLQRAGRLQLARDRHSAAVRASP